jgi:DNA modification methylase
MEWLLGVVPSGVVLDPFVGGGATGVACSRLGLPFLGFEMTGHWTAYANRRLGVTPSEDGTPLWPAEAATP